MRHLAGSQLTYLRNAIFPWLKNQLWRKNQDMRKFQAREFKFIRSSSQLRVNCSYLLARTTCKGKRPTFNQFTGLYSRIYPPKNALITSDSHYQFPSLPFLASEKNISIHIKIVGEKVHPLELETCFGPKWIMDRPIKQMHMLEMAIAW